MDDLIVLILTLIFIVAGIFGQMKKRQAVPEIDTENQPQDEENFWELLEDKIDEPQKPKVKYEATEITPEKKPERVIGYHVKYVSAFEHDLTKEVQSKPKKKKKFPLKKAIIYSEILHRKYV